MKDHGNKSKAFFSDCMIKFRMISCFVITSSQVVFVRLHFYDEKLVEREIYINDLIILIKSKVNASSQ